MMQFKTFYWISRYGIFKKLFPEPEWATSQ